MRFNRLGRTGLFVSEFCLGTMTFGQSEGQYAAASGVGQDAVEAILRRALDAGINLVDTADVYAKGQAEEILGRVIRKLGIRRTDLVVAGKFGHPTGGGPNDAGNSRRHIAAAVEASLARLGLDHLDLCQMHGWDPATPVEETLRARRPRAPRVGPLPRCVELGGLAGQPRARLGRPPRPDPVRLLPGLLLARRA